MISWWNSDDVGLAPVRRIYSMVFPAQYLGTLVPGGKLKQAAPSKVLESESEWRGSSDMSDAVEE